MKDIDWNDWKKQVVASTCVQFAKDRGLTSKHALKLLYKDEIVDILVHTFTACCRCEGDEEYWDAKRAAIGNQVYSALCTRSDAELRRSRRTNGQTYKVEYRTWFKTFGFTFDEDLTPPERRIREMYSNVRKLSIR